MGEGGGMEGVARAQWADAACLRNRLAMPGRGKVSHPAVLLKGPDGARCCPGWVAWGHPALAGGWLQVSSGWLQVSSGRALL